MSDLQCPATFHVLGPGVAPERLDLVHGAPVVAVHAAASRLPESAPVDVQTWAAGVSLDTTMLELSDLYRGTHVLVLPDAVEPPLRDERDEVVVRIDADGRAIEHVGRGRPDAEGTAS